VRVRELAQRLDAVFEGDGEKEITAVASIEAAGSSDISFVSSRKSTEQARISSAGCLIVPLDYANEGPRTVIRAPNPRAAFAAAINHLHPRPAVLPAIHVSAVIALSAEVDPTCSVGPHVAIAESTKIGAGTSIAAGCTLGSHVKIGARCTLHPNVTIYDNVEIGDNVVLHSGCVLGADGFGFVLVGDHYEKFSQIGRVVIGNNVEIGANSCVDRAALGATTIGDGTKLDNMVHIAHNCSIGSHVVIAAQTGLSGGVVVEDYAVIGGQVGIGDKARIESRAVLGSGCGVLTSKIIRSGQVVWGTPARPLKEHLHQLANLAHLDELRAEVAALKQHIASTQQLNGL
jgi:UDP-3-O-[3-hydroxymyristoyl] glucosamine N-acyltransferase